MTTRTRLDAPGTYVVLVQSFKTVPTSNSDVLELRAIAWSDPQPREVDHAWFVNTRGYTAQYEQAKARSFALACAAAVRQEILPEPESEPYLPDDLAINITARRRIEDEKQEPGKPIYLTTFLAWLEEGRYDGKITLLCEVSCRLSNGEVYRDRRGNPIMRHAWSSPADASPHADAFSAAERLALRAMESGDAAGATRWMSAAAWHEGRMRA